MTEIIEELPKDEGWKTAQSIWHNGSVYLLKVMEEIEKRNPTVMYKDQYGQEHPLVRRFCTSYTESVYMQDNPEAIKKMGEILYEIAASNPSGKCYIFKNRGKYHLSLMEYAEYYQRCCCVSELPNTGTWKTAYEIWAGGGKMLSTILEDICEGYPQQVYVDASGKRRPLVRKFKSGTRTSYYIEDTPEVIQKIQEILCERAKKYPKSQAIVKARDSNGVLTDTFVSMQEYYRRSQDYFCEEAPSGWKPLYKIWAGGKYYKMPEVLQVLADKNITYDKNPLVKKYRNGPCATWHLQDSGKALEAFGNTLVLWALFEPDGGAGISLRKIANKCINYLSDKKGITSLSCPQKTMDWEEARDAWIGEAKKRYPKVSSAIALKNCIQEIMGINFPQEVVNGWVARDPWMISVQGSSCETPFYSGLNGKQSPAI